MDTNGFGAGKLSRSDLTKVSQMVRNGVKVVVPDVVCHELSVHVIEAFDHVRFDLLSAAGFSEVDSLRSVDSARVYRGIVASLESVGCDVRVSESAWWMSGVVNQILLTPPAEVKREVRTGAADSIVASHALKLQREYGSLLVISNDAVLVKHFESLGISTAATLQKATGMVLNNASGEILHHVLDEVWGDRQWKAIFVELVEQLFDSETVHDLEILGFSNLVAGDDQMYGTAVFSLEEACYVDKTNEGPNNVWSKGRIIFSGEVKIDASSLLPSELRSVQEISSQTNYAEYPAPIEPEEYVRIEQSCITDPQVGATFEIVRTSRPNTNVATITVCLDDEVVAIVELVESQIERFHGTDIWVDRYNSGVSVVGPLASGEAPRRITTAGVLGSRVLRCWSEKMHNETVDFPGRDAVSPSLNVS
jgi:hypothetical protein